MKAIQTMRRTRARSGLWPLLGAASLGLLLAACDLDSLLDVPTTDIVPGEVVRDTANLPSLRNGVLFEFARAYTGPSGSNAFPGIIGTSGVFSDEQWYSSSFPNMREIDARNVNIENTAVDTVFRHIQRARNWAEVASERYGVSPRANTADHALVTNLAGFTYIFFAENFCSGVPFSQATLVGAIEYGPGHTTEEILDLAIQRFDAAATIAQAAGGAAGTAQLNLARVGKARALLNLGRRADAAAVAAEVPSGYAHLVNYSESASGQNNGIWAQINSNRRSSIASQEGTVNQGLRYFDRNATTAGTMTLDPRVPVHSRTIGLFTNVPLFRQSKYATQGSDAPLASYVEAQLIVAEHLLADGQSDAYLPVLNQLRQNLPTLLPTLGFTPPAGGFTPLAALQDPGTPSERILQLYGERARWLWLTAHRLGDLRRLMRHYGFQEGEVFPTGTTIFGRPYGNDVNFPIPFGETNNPEFPGQCFDRNP